MTVSYGFTNQEDLTVTLDAGNNLSSSYNQHEVFSDSTVVNKIFKGKNYFLK